MKVRQDRDRQEARLEIFSVFILSSSGMRSIDIIISCMLLLSLWWVVCDIPFIYFLYFIILNCFVSVFIYLFINLFICIKCTECRWNYLFPIPDKYFLSFGLLYFLFLLSKEHFVLFAVSLIPTTFRPYIRIQEQDTISQ